jgi:hypothetical protein
LQRILVVDVHTIHSIDRPYEGLIVIKGSGEEVVSLKLVKVVVGYREFPVLCLKELFFAGILGKILILTIHEYILYVALIHHDHIHQITVASHHIDVQVTHLQHPRCLILDIFEILERSDKKSHHVHHYYRQEKHPNKPGHVVNLAQMLHCFVVLLLLENVFLCAKRKGDRVLFLLEVLLELILCD